MHNSFGPNRGDLVLVLKPHHWWLLKAVALLACLWLAEQTYGTTMPWDAPVLKLRDSLTGPVAWAIALIALVAVGATLIFGRSDLSEFAQRALYIVLVFTIVFLGVQLVNFLFPAATSPSGALLAF